MYQKKAGIVPGMTGLPSPWQVVRYFVRRMLRWFGRIYKKRCLYAKHTSIRKLLGVVAKKHGAKSRLGSRFSLKIIKSAEL
ncbi:MAG: hypothetical protein ACLQPD_32105 [Desulfomonilaceae bacterium]